MSEPIEGLSALRDRLGRMAAHAADLEPPLRYAGGVVAATGVARIEAGGPGWIANLGGNPLLNRSGGLIRSLAPDPAVHVDGNEATVTPAGEYGRIGYWLQNGTGVYGPSGQPITAKSGGVLSFMLGGTRVYAHSVKGTPPREWVERLYNVRRYTRMPRGGHFAAAEAPQLVAEDLRSFFTELGG